MTKVSLVQIDPERSLHIPVDVILPGQATEGNIRQRNISRVEQNRIELLNLRGATWRRMLLDVIYFV